MNKLLPGGLVTLLAICLVAHVDASAGAEAPNVLWVMSDDLRPQLGCYGDSAAITPNIDSFASNAILFERAYVQCAVCSPSRNSMLSGLRPHTTGLHGFGVRLRERVPEVVTLPQCFKQNGYHTQAFGKIFHIYAESMLGSEDDRESWSEPLTLPSLPVWGPEQNALRNQLIEQARARGEQFKHPHDWPRAETWDDSDLPDDAMQDGETTALAENFLKSRQGNDQPFFLAVGFLRPHLPFNAPRKYWDLYDPDQLVLPSFRTLPQHAPPWTVPRGIVENYYNLPPFEELDDAFLRRYLQAYLACVSYVDHCFGRLLKALEESGHADNTIILFMGDHGYQMGEYDSWGHKHSNFEISVRAPLIVSAPGMKAAGKHSQKLVEFLDLYPTLCELASLSPPEDLDGKSFVPLFDDPTAPHREAAFSEMQRGERMGRSIRTEGYRLTEWRDPSGKIVARELYDHRQDQTGYHLETMNIAGDAENADLVAELSRRIAEEFGD